MTIRSAFVLLTIAAAPLLASAQTLPPSTQDRQAIANLQYQANLPGTSAADKANIQRQIIQLQYQINTRPAIEPMPTISPTWGKPISSLPNLGGTSAAMGPTIYGSCDADRAVIAYLKQQAQLPSTTRQERDYANSQRAELEKDLKAKGC